ncbi:beta-ketoacyl synthase N-terminal-like domain-containing protein [Streptomyces sp. NPDC021096]|uniref:type I polyketide synthase n=1 Tax=Streptomyces sp. NPDC021096 TaxID=3154792 RepID=UPI0033E455DC
MAESADTIRRQGELLQKLLLEKYEPIAVVGIGLRLPGGNNSLEEFTDFLRAGSSATVPVPTDRWEAGAFAPGRGAKEAGSAQAGGFLDRIDLFDARFFNISPKGANWIDPQQRLVLETAWEALEHANIDPTALRGGNGGVYMGASNIDYAMELEGLGYDELDGNVAPGVSHAGVCGRLSYFLGWRGPSISIDTACSASLVALHYAVEGLRRGECDIALCGGVNAIHHPRTTMLFRDLEALAPDGRCKTFDDSADGYGRAEGCGVLVLKRMSDAKRDKDTVLALVRGTAVGQDGESAGLYVPNGLAQETVMRRALTAGALQSSDVQFVEAHGTGTPLGDPIEMGAISDVFAASHSAQRPVVVSSHKANIGHMEAAAGIGGVVKAVAQMREGAFFPHLGFTTPSTRIPWERLPVTVPAEAGPWQAPTRRAVVNSFGFTGTIASAVLEEAPHPPVPDPATDPAAATDPAPDAATGSGAGSGADSGGSAACLFTLSAKSERSLAGQIERYQKFLGRHLGLDVADLCYTANVGRAHFAHRLSGVVKDREGLERLLDDGLDALTTRPGKDGGGPRKVAFLFTGQGSQHVGMGAGLYRRHDVFRAVVDECDELFAPHLGRSIKAMMFGETDKTGETSKTGETGKSGAAVKAGGEAAEEIHRTRYTQPALFVLEYALARLWLSWGVRPSAMIGHSLGEIVAATVAGLFSLPDAVRLVAVRAALMDSVPAPGAMAAVRADAQTVAPLVEKYPDLAIAALNAPSQVVVSGGRRALEELVGQLRRQDVMCKPLSVSQAFHSPLMAEIAEEFRAVLQTVEFREPELAFISNLTGEPARWRQISRPEYWVRHLTEPVDFMGGMRTLERRGPHVFVEIGPAGTLSALAKRCLPAKDQVWLTSLQPGVRDDSVLLKAVSRLYEQGLPVSWPAFHRGSTRRKVALPTYAFDRKRYWLPLTGRTTPQAPTPTPAPTAAAAGVAERDTDAPPPALSAPTSAAPLPPSPEQLAALTADERREALTGFVREVLAATLGFDDACEVEAGANFSELGLDSLGAVDLREALQNALRITLPVSEVFAHPTARLLAAAIDQQLPTTTTAAADAVEALN